ncbi:GNAT family N-acetyltransferase [Actinomyces radicidentis]|uniref:GNAT family N-acetyltransferase n=1 Tax=Actinomyces radicidentis TaxID=111015 RepID=UPI0026DF1F32|nr:GNAT family N-acetyltransferase [Actinomyces radicidentis]
MRISPFTEDDARAVCAWRYPAPYDVYDHPDFAVAAAEGWAIARAETRATQCRAVRAAERLISYSRLFHPDGHDLLGLGMEPSVCGRGRGSAFVRLVLTDATARADGPVQLKVRSFNQRALAVYERVGCREVDRRTLHLPCGPEEVIVLISPTRGLLPQ